MAQVTEDSEIKDPNIEKRSDSNITKNRAYAQKNVKETAPAAKKPKNSNTQSTKLKTPVKAGPKATRAKQESAVSSKKSDADKNDLRSTKSKASIKPTRPRIERRSKKYREVYKLIDKTKEYILAEAIDLLPKLSFTKFTPSVEVHINLGIDLSQADQAVRAMVVLPHTSGKSQRVAVVAAADDQAKAKQAGADIVGEENLLEDISKGKLDFDILVATPALMPKLGQHAKLLGPKGLMPNPKSGTVTNDIAKTVKELKSGRVEFRSDSNGIIHQTVGKLELKAEQLTNNIQALLKAVQQAKPSSLKGAYIKKISLSTTMSPSVKLNAAQTLNQI